MSGRKIKQRKVTMAEYERECDKIIAQDDGISKTLIELLEYAGTVEIVAEEKEEQ